MQNWVDASSCQQPFASMQQYDMAQHYRGDTRPFSSASHTMNYAMDNAAMQPFASPYLPMPHMATSYPVMPMPHAGSTPFMSDAQSYSSAYPMFPMSEMHNELAYAQHVASQETGWNNLASTSRVSMKSGQKKINLRNQASNIVAKRAAEGIYA